MLVVPISAKFERRARNCSTHRAAAWSGAGVACCGRRPSVARQSAPVIIETCSSNTWAIRNVIIQQPSTSANYFRYLLLLSIVYLFVGFCELYWSVKVNVESRVRYHNVSIGTTSSSRVSGSWDEQPHREGKQPWTWVSSSSITGKVRISYGARCVDRVRGERGNGKHDWSCIILLFNKPLCVNVNFYSFHWVRTTLFQVTRMSKISRVSISKIKCINILCWAFIFIVNELSLKISRETRAKANIQRGQEKQQLGRIRTCTLSATHLWWKHRPET